jgi:hypothetical protein
MDAATMSMESGEPEEIRLAFEYSVRILRDFHGMA